MWIIGIVGGICAGKTVVAHEFTVLGARHFDADKVSHRLLTKPSVAEDLTAIFGREILSPEGAIDRKKLAEIVFQEGPQAAAALRRLESVLHPLVLVEFYAEARQAAREGIPALVLDAPLLLEAKWAKLCHRLICVDASPAVRAERARFRGFDAESLARRERRQKSLEFKRLRADFMIDNAASREQVQAQVERIWRLLFG